MGETVTQTSKAVGLKRAQKSNFPTRELGNGVFSASTGGLECLPLFNIRNQSGLVSCHRLHRQQPC